MKCPKCNGKGYIYTNAFGTNGNLRCDVCGGHGKILSNQMTNEEWFASLPTEEKAKVLNDLYWRFGYKAKLYYNLEPTKESFEKWLKQPHKEN